MDFFKEFEFLERDGKGSVEVAKPFLPSMFDSVLHSFNPDQPTTGFARNRYSFCLLLSRMVGNVSWFPDIISQNTGKKMLRNFLVLQWINYIMNYCA